MRNAHGCFIGAHRRIRGRHGQSSLELTAALVLTVFLLAAAARVFVWLNRRVVSRQVDYEATRVQAGSQPSQPVPFTEKPVTPATDPIYGGVEINESAYPAVNFFN